MLNLVVPDEGDPNFYQRFIEYEAVGKAECFGFDCAGTLDIVSTVDTSDKIIADSGMEEIDG